MSALVVTVLIATVWGAAAAAGYVRGGWREVVTLAGLLLSAAMVAEWAAPNGADLAGLFGDDVYRSSTFVALLYLIGGVLLLGYFGGSRLPRPAPLSATERFAGGALGFFNGGLLTALGLRTLRAHTFRPGDGAALAETPLASFLAGNAGYLIAAAMLAGAIAPFVSAFLLRGSRHIAEHAEEPSFAAPYVPTTAHEPEQYLAPRPTSVAPFAPPPAVAYFPSAPPASPPPGSDVRMVSSPPAQTGQVFATPPQVQVLIPTAPSVPAVAAAATLPTPALPPASVEPPSLADERDGIPTVALAVPPQALERAAPVALPPGFDIAASQPLPVALTKDDAPEPPVAHRPEAESPAFPVADTAAPEESRGDHRTANELDAPPAPVEPFVMERAPSPPADTDGFSIVLRPAAHGPDDRATAPDEPEPGESETEAEARPAPSHAFLADDLPAPPSSEQGADENEPDAPPRVPRARVAAVRQPSAPRKPLHMTVPSALQRPVQPGPQMHPCPVCDYPVRNEARFCPNCGTAQPVPATYSS